MEPSVESFFVKRKRIRCIEPCAESLSSVTKSVMYYHNENSFVAILVIDLQDESFVIVFMMVDLTLWLRTMKLRKATITWATRKDELELTFKYIHRVIERSHQYYTKLNPTILKRIVEFEEHCERSWFSDLHS